jgi:hypothetical protein
MPQDHDLNDRPALFVPTYPPPTGFGDDTGLVRPVPSGVPYYLCWGIQPLSAFQPGASFTVKVAIGNWQGGNSASMAMAAVWWSPALSGPTIPDPDKFIGFATVPVSPHGGRISTHDLTTVIAEDAPPHICLLAKVWHALDMPPTTVIAGKSVEVADPIHDRHWAQHNLVAIPAVGAQKMQFLATNPTPMAATYELLVQPMGQEKWPTLAKHERATAVPTRASFRLSGQHDGAETRGVNILRHQVDLKAGEQRSMTLSIELAEPLHAGTFAAFEVLQLKFEKPTGGFGIILRADR